MYKCKILEVLKVSSAGLKPNIWADSAHKLVAVGSKGAAFLSTIHQPPHFH